MLGNSLGLRSLFLFTLLPLVNDRDLSLGDLMGDLIDTIQPHIPALALRYPSIIRALSMILASVGSLGISVVPGLAQSSISSGGINAEILHQEPYTLTGRKISIGQVEIGRPGQFGLDKVSLRNRMINAAGLFFRDRLATGDLYVDTHANNVASIMVSTDKLVRGVAPQARLYSSAVGDIEGNGQPQECRASNYLALQNGGDLRAINFSFGESLRQDPRPNAQLDGNALLTQCVDWSARVHDVLYVIAGNQGQGGIPIPTDNFNGVNVAFTRRDGGAFRKVDFANLGAESGALADRRVGQELNLAGRRSISLVAPGAELDLLNPDGTIVRASGTSFAAPHVTATVALLQEYGDRRLQDKMANPNSPNAWSLDSRRHEVMRSVLLNSADKIQDPGDGRYLGMSHTIVDQLGQTWLESEAHMNPLIPLDLQTGTGQLNAFRAYQQFSAGQYPIATLPPDSTVGVQGWDYGQVGVSSSQDGATFQDYVIDEPLQANSYFSATLTWDRWVDLVDSNGDGEFNVGESFRDRGLNNLDLYLMPLEATNIRESVAASTSNVDSVEHIFAPIPTTQRYKLRVYFRQQVNEPTQAYGLAWWGQGSGATGL